MQSRLKSKVAWVSILALIYFVVKKWFNVDIPEWDVFVELLLTALVGFGILNNPTDENHF